MIYALALIPIAFALVALFAAFADHQTVCDDLSARSYQEFKAGDAPVIVSRCTPPKPLQ